MSQGERTIDDLLTGYQRAEASAFDQFYERTNEALFNFLLVKLRNRADAEDCLHDTYFKIHAAIMSYDPAQNGLTWVFTIARNTAIDRIRKNLRQGIRADVDLDSLPQAESQAPDFSHELSLVLQQLSPAERELIERKFLAGDSYEDLAASMDLTPVNLRQKVSRIIRKLKRAGPERASE